MSLIVLSCLYPFKFALLRLALIAFTVATVPFHNSPQTAISWPGGNCNYNNYHVL